MHQLVGFIALYQGKYNEAPHTCGRAICWTRYIK